MTTFIELQVLAKIMEYMVDGSKAIPVILENIKLGETIKMKSIHQLAMILKKSPR